MSDEPPSNPSEDEFFWDRKPPEAPKEDESFGHRVADTMKDPSLSTAFTSQPVDADDVQLTAEQIKARLIERPQDPASRPCRAVLVPAATVRQKEVETQLAEACAFAHKALEELLDP